jgi:basic membrane protein A
LRIQTTKGLSTVAAAVIVIVIIVVAGAGYYFYVASTPGTSTTSSSSQQSSTSLPGKGMTIGIVYDTGGKGDKSFNDMAYAGVQNAKSTLGVSYIELGSTSANDYVPNMEKLVADNVSLIVCVGFLMDQAVTTEAAAHPNVKFAQIDGDVYNTTNVVAIKFQEHVGSALVGALAVALTKSDKIGFIGGMDIGIIHKFWHGFAFGASWASKYLNKSVTVLPPQYTGTTPSAWNAPDVAKSEAANMYQQGADIIFAAAGASGTGLFDQTGALDQSSSWNWSTTTAPPYFAIGVDADQDYYGTQGYFVQHNQNGPYTAPSFVLTSEMKRVDVGVFNVIKSAVFGNYSNFYNNPQTWAPSYWSGPTATNTKGVYLL